MRDNERLFNESRGMNLEDVGQTIVEEEKEQDIYEPADEVERIARELIDKYHSHLIEARIMYLFRRGAWSSQNRGTWGKAQKVTGAHHYLTGLDFLITISLDVWDELNNEQRRALVDHELEHCCKTEDDKGNPKFFIQGHDVEDFVSIIGRHGFWTPDLKKVKDNHLQMKLFGEDGAFPMAVNA